MFAESADQLAAGTQTWWTGVPNATLQSQLWQQAGLSPEAAANAEMLTDGLTAIIGGRLALGPRPNVGSTGTGSSAGQSAKGAEWADAGFDTTNLQSKLEGYLLDASHPQNQTKADWFKQALGFDKSNWQSLASQIRFDEGIAVATKTSQYGQTFEQVIPITGVNGKTKQGSVCTFQPKKRGQVEMARV